MINQLPPELINNIILHLDIRSVMNLSSVNHYTNINCKYALENQWEKIIENEKIFIDKKQKLKLSLEEKKIYMTIISKLYEHIKFKRYDKIYLSLVNSFTRNILSTSYSFYKETFTLIIYSPIDTYCIEKLLKQTTIINTPVIDVNCAETLKDNCVYLFRSTYTVLNDYWV